MTRCPPFKGTGHHFTFLLERPAAPKELSAKRGVRESVIRAERGGKGNCAKARPPLLRLGMNRKGPKYSHFIAFTSSATTVSRPFVVRTASLSARVGEY